MGFVSRGFRGRRETDASAGRIPPGQYVTPDFPVLSAGPTPRVQLDAWRFEITGQVDEPRAWTWEELQALPAEDVTADILPAGDLGIRHAVQATYGLDHVPSEGEVRVLAEGWRPNRSLATAYLYSSLRGTAPPRGR